VPIDDLSTMNVSSASFLWHKKLAAVILRHQEAAHGDDHKCNQLKRLFNERAKVDKETFYSTVANKAEEGMRKNDLDVAYRAVWQNTITSHVIDASGCLWTTEWALCKNGRNITM